MKPSRVLLAFFASISTGMAATLTWDDANSNNGWNTTSGNWTGGAIFNTGDDAVFAGATGETVTVAAGGVTPNSTTITGNGSYTFTGASILGGLLTKGGTGSLTLAAANSFSGVKLDAGSLTLTNAGALGTGTLTVGTGAAGSASNPGGGTASNFLNLSMTGNQTIATNIALANDATTTYRKIVMTGSSGDTFNLSGTISGGGTGTVLFLDNTTSGDISRVFRISGTNTFTGTVRINRGSLQIDSDAALGASTNSVIYDSNPNARLIFTNAMTYTHGTSLLAATNFDTGTNAVAASGIISGSGSLTKVGAGTLTLTGANTNSGGLIISAGTVQVGNGGTLGVGGVSNAGALVFNSTSAITVAGVISGAGTVTQSGSGITTFSSNNTYTAGTTLSGGAISIATGGGLGTGDLTVTRNSGGNFLTVANNSAVTLANNISLAAPTAAATYILVKNSAGASSGTQLDLTGVISGGNANATLQFNSSAGSDNTTTYRLSGTNTFQATINLNRGALILANAGGFGSTANVIQLNGNNSATLGDLRYEISTTTANAIQLQSSSTIGTAANNVEISGVISGSGNLGKVGTGTLTLSGANTYTGATTITTGTLQIGNGGATGAIGTGNITDNAALVFNRTAATTVVGVISGTGTVTQNNTGLLSLNGVNTHSGGTILSNGALSIANGSGLGTGALTVNRVSGGDLLTVANNAAVTVANNISLAAPTTAATFNIIKNSAGAGTGTQLDFSGVISGGSANSTLFLNTNTLSDNTTVFRFSGNNTFLSTINLNRGAISVANANGLGNAANIVRLDGNGNSTAGDLRYEISTTTANSIQLAATTSYIHTGANAVNFSGVISGSGAMTKLGTGTMTLSATNTYTGGTTVSAGSLFVTGALAGGAVNVGSGATLGGTGTIGGPVTIASGAVFAPGLNAIGTLTAGNNLTLGGTSNFEINSTANTHDLVIVTAALTFGGTLNVTDLGSGLAAGQSFDLFDFGSSSGQFSSINLAALDNGLSWDMSQLYTTGTITVVPEPDASWLIGGVGVLMLVRRRRA